eukprot:3337237-Ditylum_brightwellii.AAC.1
MKLCLFNWSNYHKGKYSNATNYLANVIFDEDTQQNLEYRDSTSAAKKIGHLSQGISDRIPTGADMIHLS